MGTEREGWGPINRIDMNRIPPLPASMSISTNEEAREQASVTASGTNKSRREVGRRRLGHLGGSFRSPTLSPDSQALTNASQTRLQQFRNTPTRNVSPSFRNDVESVYSIAEGTQMGGNQHVGSAQMGFPYLSRDQMSTSVRQGLQEQDYKVTYQASQCTTDRYTQKGERIIGEYMKEVEYPTEQKVMVEEEFERIVVVPEKRMVERVVHDKQKIRKRIVEVEVPVYVEVEVEVPEIEYHEIPVEVPERRVRENIIQRPRIEYRERIVEVPKIIYEEKEVDVAVPEYHEVQYETIIEVPEIQTETVIIPKTVPQYVDVDVPEVVDVYVDKESIVQMPVTLECQTKLELQFPMINAVYKRTKVPVYVPKLIEVAVPSDQLSETQLAFANDMSERLETVCRGEPIHLNVIEGLVNDVQRYEQMISGDKKPGNWPALWERKQISIMQEVVEKSQDISNLLSKAPILQG